MAIDPGVAIEVLHVIAASCVVGYLAVLAVWRGSARKDAAALRHFLDASRAIQMRVVIPSVVLLLLTGLALTLGPYRRVPLALASWAQASVLLTLILGVILWSGLGTPARKMLPFVEAGEHTGPAMDRLWSEWRAALLGASAISVVAVGIMVYQGS